MLRQIFGWVVSALLVALLLTLVAVRPFFYDLVEMPNDVMLPTVAPNTFVRVEKQGFGIASLTNLYWRYGEPERVLLRGDVVMFRHRGEPMLGRVIGVAGDEVRYRGDGSVVVNGAVVPMRPDPKGPVDGYLDYTETLDGRSWRMRLWTRYGDDRPAGRRQVAPGTVFVLGDSRDRAVDSREIGGVALGDVLGVVDRVSGDSNQRWPTDVPFTTGE